MEQDRTDRRRPLLPHPQLRYNSPTRRPVAGSVVASGSPERRRLIREMEKSRENERMAYKRSSSSQDSQDYSLNRSPGGGSPVRKAQKKVQFANPTIDNEQLTQSFKEIDQRLLAIETNQKEFNDRIEMKLKEILEKLDSLQK
ncbi:uncharacterized protein KQ657_004421 [Scheffersomyces spartinae]|uniref:Uncharacterized protein n=1 Tax=Scheffersomyces spartinae TaxID=45513 RepID=A0A9P7VB91_9ASCO|nr:uncharacterized protein KQ657_004421 [Scheffersomyces spartinae]KAG7194742.1 hypothetical protein KQ657_004421 [Scheffersomyces spartinae]